MSEAAIGCDYGSKLNLVVVNNANILEQVVFTLEPFHQQLLGLSELLDEWKIKHGATKLVFEAPWVRGNRWPQAALILVRTASVIETVATLGGFEVSKVHPQTWRSKVYGGYSRKEDMKQKARDFVWEKFRVKIKDHNIAEASLIGLYGIMS